MIKTFVKIWNRIEELFLVYSLAVMVLVVFIQVIMRYLFNNSLSWSEELVRYLFIWQIWLGASVGIKNNDHIRIEIITKKLGTKQKEGLDILINILLLGFYVFLTVEGFVYLQSVIAKDMTSTGLQIPLAVVYVSLPFGSAIVTIRLLCRIAWEIIHFRALLESELYQAKGVDS